MRSRGAHGLSNQSTRLSEWIVANSEIPIHRLFWYPSNQAIDAIHQRIRELVPKLQIQRSEVLEENMKDIAYQTKRTVSGFTLIELLVVISIIGILVA